MNTTTIGTEDLLTADLPRRRPAAVAQALGVRPFLSIVCLFWLYATLSAVLYIHSIETYIASELGQATVDPLFAQWDARAVQYALLLPPLLGCYWRSLALGWHPLARRLPAQIALGVGFAALAYWALWGGILLCEDTELHPHKGWDDMWPMITLSAMSWLGSFVDFLVRYGFGLALVTGFAVYKRYRDAEVRVAALEQQWGAARLAALRMQLSPHTLFNLLHTIRGQIAWDPPAAQAMVVQLADLLRRLLRAGEREFARLADELQFVRLYLELQSRRFCDRLRIDLPDPQQAPNAWVPSLILQPLVENAVAHGLAGHDGPVTVAIETRAEGERLRLTVTNDTAANCRFGGEGVGLRNVRERLAVQFGAAAGLTVGPAGERRWCAVITMPRLDEPPTTAARP